MYFTFWHWRALQLNFAQRMSFLSEKLQYTLNVAVSCRVHLDSTSQYLRWKLSKLSKNYPYVIGTYMWAGAKTYDIQVHYMKPRNFWEKKSIRINIFRDWVSMGKGVIRRWISSDCSSNTRTTTIRRWVWRGCQTRVCCMYCWVWPPIFHVRPTIVASWTWKLERRNDLARLIVALRSKLLHPRRIWYVEVVCIWNLGTTQTTRNRW